MINIRKLEAELWESADLLRAGSKLTSNQYCMPVLGLIFLRYAYSRFKKVEAEILKNRPSRGGRVMPVEASDFSAKSALFLPKEAQYEYLVNLPENIAAAGLINKAGHPMNSLGEVVNNAMQLIEDQSEQLTGVLPKSYTDFTDELLAEMLRIFNNSALDDVGGDIIGRIYEYFLNKFAKNIASDDGVFFTPKSLVKMIVNIIETKQGVLLDCACGSTLNGCCDYIMANPPFNVDKVKAESCENAGRLPFGLPSVNKNKEVGNANYLWISYFYSYLNEHGRAGFVMASSATDSQGKDKDIREKLIKTGHVDVMISVGNNFFYTKSLPCSLWFFNKAKGEAIRDKVLFIDARNYYTVVDRTMNEWSEWQLKNLNAIVWLYRGETDKYTALLQEYHHYLHDEAEAAENDDLKEAVYQDSFVDIVSALKEKLSALRKTAKAEVEAARKRDKKSVQQQNDDRIAYIENMLTVAKEANWLYEKFGDGVYADVLGLCKLATLTEIEEKGWSLTPGAYVGVAPVEDDGVDFVERMAEIHRELLYLQAESNDLMDTISQNMKEMGI